MSVIEGMDAATITPYVPADTSLFARYLDRVMGLCSHNWSITSIMRCTQGLLVSDALRVPLLQYSSNNGAIFGGACYRQSHTLTTAGSTLPEAAYGAVACTAASHERMYVCQSTCIMQTEG